VSAAGCRRFPILRFRFAEDEDGFFGCQEEAVALTACEELYGAVCLSLIGFKGKRHML
jgi:hypothetical protein